MINNVVIVSGIQQSDSVIHIHVSLLFQILFPFRFSLNKYLLCACSVKGVVLDAGNKMVNKIGKTLSSWSLYPNRGKQTNNESVNK